jgi:hypothetical protein
MVIQVPWPFDPLREEGKKLSGSSAVRLRYALVSQIGSKHLLR